MENKHQELSIIRPQELAKLLKITVQSLYNWEAKGKLPIEKVRFGPNCVGFRYKDVEAWLNGQ
ncbi:helix-turn-helix transcriptional regulator [Gracilimonas sp.]|uniref:helix-turn-helix transcriptional regulator n=1 Tax=Gracilimonas sp. TaxID=1974203 RepID=UPI003D0DFE68